MKHDILSKDTGMVLPIYLSTDGVYCHFPWCDFLGFVEDTGRDEDLETMKCDLFEVQLLREYHFGDESYTFFLRCERCLKMFIDNRTIINPLGDKGWELPND